MQHSRVRLASPTFALWRAPGVLQIGLDSPCLILAGVPDSLARALALLARPATPEELITLLPDLEPEWVPWLLARLESHGLLESAAPAEPSRVSVVGGGPIAAALTATLTGVTVQTIDPVSHAAALISTHGAEPALTVLAGPTAEPDRTLTDALFAAGRPHLLVRVEPGRAVVGPLVVPGRTPCVRCLDLSRCRLDAAWPHLLAQLCREAAEPDPVLLAWVATIASVQIRAWLAGTLPESAGGSLELGRPDFRMRSRPWSASPSCGCLVPIV